MRIKKALVLYWFLEGIWMEFLIDNVIKNTNNGKERGIVKKKGFRISQLALLMFVVAGLHGAKPPQANEPTAFPLLNPGATSSLIDDDGDPAQAMTVNERGASTGGRHRSHVRAMHGVSRSFQGRFPRCPLPLENCECAGKTPFCFAVLYGGF